jgi:ornithine carbamoyltransferase
MWQNNMTYDLMRMACLMGFDINVAGPDSKDFEVIFFSSMLEREKILSSFEILS